MFFAENLKRHVFVASRSVLENGVNVYSEPIDYFVSCYLTLPTSASARLEVSGTRYSGYMQLAGDPEYLKNIKKLDKVYVDVEPPTVTDPLATDADYVVHRIVTTPTCTTVLLRMLEENDG